MDNLLKDNISIVTTRILSSEEFRHAFVSDTIGDICYLSNKGKESNYYFPLYLYNDNNYNTSPKEKSRFGYGNMILFETPRPVRQSNIKGEILSLLVNKYGKNVSSEEMFYYIYAILYSNKYRKKYNEFLKIDFPKIPFTADYKLFKTMSKYGRELVDLHLLKSKKLEKSTAKFLEIGNSKMEKREYKDDKIYINDKQYFSGVKKEVWDYCIGGYQVLDKWLKGRAGKTLSTGDVEYLLKVISVLQNTIKLQNKIDEIYLDVEKKLA